MNKREFLKATGLMGVASVLPFGKILAEETNNNGPNNDCVLIPTETTRPFPLDLSENPFYFRQDIRENKTGVRLNLKFKIIGEDNCLPMQNVRLHIWHCDADGLYSGYNASYNVGQKNFTYLRGYQIADAQGEVEFITIFPGLYPGRICHIHFQVYVSSSYAAISQLTFPISTKQEIYAANPALYPKGADPVSLENDDAFADGHAFQMATLTPNAETGEYNAYLEVTVKGSGISSMGHLEKQNAKQFSLGQNYPNPYKTMTTIPLLLLHPADVKLDLYNLEGKLVASIQKDGLIAAQHDLFVDMDQLGLPVGNYVYQIEVNNANGIFRDCKLMTAAK